MRRHFRRDIACRTLAVARLRAVHDAAALRIERVAVVHDAAVVPHRHVADAPLMVPRQKILRGVRPQRVEQRFRLRNLQPVDISVAPPAQIQRIAFGFRMRAYQRMRSTRAFAHVGYRREALTQLAARGVSDVLVRRQLIDTAAHFRRQSLQRQIHIGETGVAARGRNLPRLQHARRRRLVAVGRIGVP